MDRLRKKLWEHMEKTGFHHVSVGQSCRWLVGEEDSIVFKVPDTRCQGLELIVFSVQR